MNFTVALLRNPDEEANWSMKLYADRLASGLKELRLAPVAFAGPRPLRLGRMRGFFHKAERYVTRYWRYPQVLHDIRADLYHIVDHANAHWVRVLPAERTVVTCHDLILLKLAAGEIPWRGPQPRVATATFRWSVAHLPQAGAVLCDSESTKRDVVRLLGCSPGRLHVVYPGLHEVFRQVLDPAVLAPAGMCFRFTWPITLLHVGSHMFYKNLEGIIEALALLPSRWQDCVHLVKAGEGFTPAQWDLMRRRGLGERVHYLGQVSLQDLVLLYNVADILAFPSLYEGFGWPPLEAMACGTPVVCSDRGALGEVVGDAACLVNPEDPTDIMRGIVRVLEDKPYRVELVRRGLEQASRFQWDHALQQIRSVYHSLSSGC